MKEVQQSAKSFSTPQMRQQENVIQDAIKKDLKISLEVAVTDAPSAVKICLMLAKMTLLD